MAIKALVEGKTQTLRLVPDFSTHGTFLSLFTTIPVFMTAFGYHINSKDSEHYVISCFLIIASRAGKKDVGCGCCALFCCYEEMEAQIHPHILCACS